MLHGEKNILYLSKQIKEAEVVEQKTATRWFLYEKHRPLFWGY